MGQSPFSHRSRATCNVDIIRPMSHGIIVLFILPKESRSHKSGGSKRKRMNLLSRAQNEDA